MTNTESRDGRGAGRRTFLLPHRPGTQESFQNQPLACPSKGSGTIPGRSKSVLYHAYIHGNKHVRNTHICIDSFVDNAIYQALLKMPSQKPQEKDAT